jgi:hypothetical protein
MLALAQYGRFAFVALVMLVRWVVTKVDSMQNRSGVWVTGRTGNVTVLTDKIF